MKFYLCFPLEKMRDAEKADHNFDESEYYDRVAVEIADMEDLKNLMAIEALNNLEDSEYMGNIADEIAFRQSGKENIQENEGEIIGISEGEIEGGFQTNSEGKGNIDGGSREVQSEQELDQGRGIVENADGQRIRREDRTPVNDRQAELGSDARTQGGNELPDLEPGIEQTSNVKETSEPNAKTTDTDENPSDSRGDTALSRNSNVSDGKGNEKEGNTQITPGDKPKCRVNWQLQN